MNNLWKDKILLLKRDDDKGDEVFIKVWLRAHYAETIRENRQKRRIKILILLAVHFING